MKLAVLVWVVGGVALSLQTTTEVFVELGASKPGTEYWTVVTPKSWDIWGSTAVPLKVRRIELVSTNVLTIPIVINIEGERNASRRSLLTRLGGGGRGWIVVDAKAVRRGGRSAADPHLCGQIKAIHQRTAIEIVDHETGSLTVDGASEFKDAGVVHTARRVNKDGAVESRPGWGVG